ncbi:hypothetical protein C0J52_06711, partial [Blattella germanica]
DFWTSSFAITYLNILLKEFPLQSTLKCNINVKQQEKTFKMTEGAPIANILQLETEKFETVPQEDVITTADQLNTRASYQNEITHSTSFGSIIRRMKTEEFDTDIGGSLVEDRFTNASNCEDSNSCKRIAQ